MEYTTEITESQLNNEGIENVAVHYTENNKLSTTESTERQNKEIPVDNVDSEEEISFDDLTIPGD